jgi:CRISPR system Cascade subunit CasD
MHEHLLFTLEGPMQAWGEIAVGEIRPSAGVPTRSGVFGLLAACLGIRRDQEEALAALRDAYGFAVRVDEAGDGLYDFHTVQTPKERKNRVFCCRRDETGPLLDTDEAMNTILSRRTYLTDASFTVCLWTAEGIDPPYALETLAEHLRRPVFIPYLGRKSCPVGKPFKPIIVQAETVLDAFNGFRAEKRSNERRRIHMDEAAAHGFDCISNEARRDMPAVFERRLFNVRRESIVLETPLAEEKKEETP